MSSDLRPPSLDDLPALVEFFANVEDWLTEGALRDRLTSRLAKVEENYRIALEDGRIAGWISIWQPEPGSERIFLNAEAQPRQRAMYERLLDWGEQRVRDLADGQTMRVHANADSENELLAGMLRERGYELVRYFFRMEVDLDEEPAQPVWPEGIAVRAFRPGDERAVYEADIEAFQDHWDFFSVPFEDWREYFLGSSKFDPELWFLATDGDEIAGFALCWSERRPNTGQVGVLGVRRPWRRRGLGTALLLRAFHELRWRGRAKVDLHVDGENLTGAVRLYERVGMRVAHRNDAYRKEIA
jgi:mycothiol synthase